MMYCVSGQNLEKGETLGYNISVSVFQELQCVFVHVIKCFDSHSHYTVKNSFKNDRNHSISYLFSGFVRVNVTLLLR